MRIGYIENIVGAYLLIWFYRQKRNVWIKVREERVPIGFREVTLERIEREGVLVPLNRGMSEGITRGN